MSKICQTYLNYQKGWLQGCLNCNKPVPLVDLFEERQYIGNVYQSLCKCKICGKRIVFDEHNYDLLLNYLKKTEV